MNTTQKGTDFELRSKEIIKSVIRNEQLGHLADTLRIYEQQEYYSKDRDAPIKFDLTIEVWPPSAERFVMIYFIECKHYEKRVPVDRIERFRDQIRQVAGVNAKAIFITNSPLQQSAYKIAESSGMMLIQGQSHDDYKILLHKSSRGSKDSGLPFFEDTCDSTQIDTGVDLIQKLIDKRILEALVEVESDDFVGYGLDRLSKKDIQDIALNELNKINPEIIKSGRKLLGLQEFKRYLESLDIQLSEIQGNDKVLATCDLNVPSIGISKEILGTNREFFILAHEFGHYVLHQKLTIGQVVYDGFDDSEYDFKTGKHRLENERHWIEWQANYFASSLIMPEENFKYRVDWCKQQLGGAGEKIFINDSEQSHRDYRKILEQMAYVYDVSKASIRYKLNELSLVVNTSHLKSIKEIIEEEGIDLFI